MSQEKVDRYKATKANRKEEVKKRKTMKALRTIGGIIIAAAIVFWLGISVYNTNQANQPRTSVNADITEMVSYIEGLSVEE